MKVLGRRQRRGAASAAVNPVAEPLPAIKRLRRRIRKLDRRVDALESTSLDHAGDIDGLIRFQHHAAERLVDLDQLMNHIRAAPGSHVDALRLTRPNGSATMGYVDRAAGDETAAYVHFEDLFRGTRSEIQDRQRPYLPLVRGRGDVLDLGCGRGEFLEILRDDGVSAVGVDLDAGMVAVALDHGLDARVRDLFDELAGRPDSSVAAVVSFQVVEHLTPNDMSRFLREVRRVLAPDGIAVIETVNPHALRAFRFFWLDLTHTVPVFPESLLAMARAAGFGGGVAYFPESTGSLDSDLRECGDYALIAAIDPEVLLQAHLIASSEAFSARA